MYVTELTYRRPVSRERSASGMPRLALRGSGDVTRPGIHDRDQRSLSGIKSVRLVLLSTCDSLTNSIGGLTVSIYPQTPLEGV